MNAHIKYITLWILTIGISGFLISCVETISPHELTKTRIEVIEQRVRSFLKQNGKLPSTLAELPKFPGRDNSIIDGWGREIEYKVNGNRITLSSQGETGLNAEADLDLIHTFDMDR